ncbi:sulfatase [Novipirellula artificiosorum]|uniref:Choline-sulfatase n=1 Tax=Novipirellula artificiosorum TaxID=2528016 RepID=A0A5C6DQ77_9BACT|nr:sulfatase [Novipirellula artificiosorum]TWU38324.1 Choline-sulfatase [Novipirellula artificiosorum]
MKLQVALTILFGGFVAGSPLFADSAQIKNVLFIISDDLKASVLGCYGDQVCQTPNLDKLASRGMVFNHAYCQGTWCAPSRQSFMFSRYQGKGDLNLGQHFKEQGYYSARVGKIYHMRVPGDIIAGTDGEDVASSWTERFNSSGQEAHTPGDYACLNLNIFTDELEGRQSTKMPHRMFVSVEYDGDGSDQPDHKSATKAIELLQQHKEDPFFLAVGLVRPHYPMVAPRQYFEPYPWQQIQMPPSVENDLDDIPKLGWAGTRNAVNEIGKHPENQKRMWTAYYAAVTFMDEQVGRILDELDRLGLRDNTAIVFTSDHGYHLGEHTFWQKSNLHEEVLRVPMIMSVPGLKPGRTNAMVELTDIYPTLSELAGLEIPEEVQGKSLVPVLKDPDKTVRKAAISIHNGLAIRTAKWAYIRYNDSSQELYDMEQDPSQFTNVVSAVENREIVSELDGMMNQISKQKDIQIGKKK